LNDYLNSRLVGSLLFLLTLSMGFTGYLLPSINGLIGRPWSGRISAALSPVWGR